MDSDPPTLTVDDYPSVTDGETVDAEIPISWTASGGTIDEDGTFVSNQGGNFTITAAVGDISDTAKAIVYVPAPSSGPEPGPVPGLRIHPVDDLTFSEGESGGFVLQADIPDVAEQSTVRYAVYGLPPGLMLNETTGEVSGFLDYSAAGEYSVTAAVSADGYESSSTSFSYTVLNTDTTPYWYEDMPEVIERVIYDDTGYTAVDLSMFAFDIDGDDLTFEDIDYENLRLDGHMLLTFIPGEYYVTLKVIVDTPSDDPDLDSATITSSYLL